MILVDKIKIFFYKRVLKNFLFSSRLARRSILGLSDSGITFDYIYAGNSFGYKPLGKIIDNIIFALPSVKAVQTRKDFFKNVLISEINENKQNNIKTRIIDLASGPARYLVEAITHDNKDSVEVLCFDIDKRSLNYGKKISNGKPMRYAKADVFNLSLYKKLSKKVEWIPNIIIASGLYNFVNRNTFLLSLKEVYDNLSQKGLFVFDNLISNPNKKLLENIAINQQNKPLTFFYRQPEEIKAMLCKIGFKCIKVNVDKRNIFAIYSGRK